MTADHVQSLTVHRDRLQRLARERIKRANSIVTHGWLAKVERARLFRQGERYKGWARLLTEIIN